MLTIIYCTRESKPKHKEHLIKTSGLHKHVEVIEIINNGESLTKSYNRGLKQASNKVIVFCHNDIEIETKQWGKKLLKIFDNNPEYGIIGVAGSKYMHTNGRWWHDVKHMFGRVKHTHEGKSWLSSYSEDLANNLEQVVNVDGLFFAVKKEMLATRDDKGNVFDENVKGFHFYDVDFSFYNHITNSCKVGVTTKIRINHMSIGETNEEWEKNREKFIETYKDKLPVRIPQTFENKKLKILIGCLNFKGLTGSEISTMETAKGLVKAGCDVTVVSNIGEKYRIMAKRYGIKTASINEPPGFKLGDGKWKIQTQNGLVPSKPNTLYKIGDIKYDVIHTNHTPITERLIQLFPETPKVNIVRSEVIDLENPIVHESIKSYIAVRPTIKDYIVENFNISKDDVEIIYNPFDKSRFKPNPSIKKNTNKEVILFVGTMDYLREKPIRELVLKTKEDKQELWLVGKDTGHYGNLLSNENDHVKYFEENDKIEEFYQKCDMTAGIFLGRTTIEGFLCNKPAWIYKVDKSGNILDKEFMEVPKDMSIFDTDEVIKKIKNKYIEVYNS